MCPEATDLNRPIKQFASQKEGFLKSDLALEPRDGDIPLFYINLKNLITEEINCNGIQVTAIVDTGAVVTVIAPSLIQHLQLEIETWDGPSVILVNGQRISFFGVVNLQIELGGRIAEGKAYVLEMSGIPLMLGSDFPKTIWKI